MAITRSQIFEAAEGLDAAGLNPTLAAVRKALGRGSFTTISEAMGEWRKLRARRAPPNSEPLPEALRLRLDDAGAELWAQSIAVAEKRIASERESFAKELERIEGERLETVATADEFARALENAEARIAALSAAEEQARREVASLQAKFARTAERAAVAEVRAHESEQRVAILDQMLTETQATNRDLLQAIGCAVQGTGVGQ